MDRQTNVCDRLKEGCDRQTDDRQTEDSDQNSCVTLPCALQVWDGRFSSTALVTVLVREAMDSGLLFTRPFYTASIPENSSNVTVVTVVNAIGHRLNEPLKYVLLNAGGRFVVRPTSGVVLTAGVPFNREEQESYELVVEASREYDRLRVARVTVQVQVRNDVSVLGGVCVCAVFMCVSQRN